MATGRSHHLAGAPAGAGLPRRAALLVLLALLVFIALAFAAPALRDPASGRQPLLPGLTLEEFGPEKGVIVTSIQSDSPALVAGIAVGDRIVALDAQRVASLADVRRYVGPHHPMAVDMRLIRGEKPIELTYVFPSRSDP